MINRVILVGRLTKEVSLAKTTSGKSVASFTIAVQRNIKKPDGTYDADFINCVAWGNTAEYINSYSQKGQIMGVDGRLQTRSYTASDGTTKYVTEVVVESVQLVMQKKEDFDTGAPLDISEDNLPF